MKCIYSDYCTLKGSPQCGEFCTKYKLFTRMMDDADIPVCKRTFRKMDVPKEDAVAYNRLSNLCNGARKYISSGTNLVLWSENPGNGKTTWAIKVMLAYFNSIWSRGTDNRGMFIHVPSFLLRVKNAMNTPDEGLEEIKRKITEVDLLILDDIGTCSLSEYDVNLLTHIIDQRWLNERSTIYTTNRNREKLTQVLGARLTDRIYDSCQFHFTAPSRRNMI